MNASSVMQVRGVLLLHTVLLLSAVVVSTTPAAVAADKERPPNVIVFFSDDQGYDDVSFQGSDEIPTPHIDALAREGVICTDGYVTAHYCVPSRAGLLTGRHQARFGFEISGWNKNMGMPVEETTIADGLSANGYATIAIGKWHLGQLPQFRPLARGFTDHYGFYGGGRSYLPLSESIGVPFIPKDPQAVELYRNLDKVDDPPLVTTAFGEAAVEYIEEHKDDPFFIYLAFNAPHLPLQAPQRDLDRFPNLTGGRKTYAAMIAAMDDAIGQVTEKLKREGLEEETLIFFLTDNGGHTTAVGASNAPLRGQKSTVYEGGIRVPFVVKWTGHLPAGTTYTKPVSSLDIAATSYALANVEIDPKRPLDGVDLIPYLTGANTELPHPTLYWRIGPDYAMRDGDWKLTAQDGKAEVYHLSEDISESQNLAEQRPELLAKLQAKYDEWSAQMMDPIYSGGLGGRKAKVGDRNSESGPQSTKPKL
ncbi:MAG: sulfatase-like hydrolase/transferase [Pirellulaceae bacterium]|jgi:arylsulfatase A-like enzyme|nr:sulfatase-like hydrolase/transferase [Pirellulaceae bacterium]